MALNDINILVADELDFILEIPLGTLEAPLDILFMDDAGMVFEIPSRGGESFGGGFF